MSTPPDTPAMIDPPAHMRGVHPDRILSRGQIESMLSRIRSIPDDEMVSIFEPNMTRDQQRMVRAEVDRRYAGGLVEPAPAPPRMVVTFNSPADASGGGGGPGGNTAFVASAGARVGAGGGGGGGGGFAGAPVSSEKPSVSAEELERATNAVLAALEEGRIGEFINLLRKYPAFTKSFVRLLAQPSVEVKPVAPKIYGGRRKMDV